MRTRQAARSVLVVALTAVLAAACAARRPPPTAAALPDAGTIDALIRAGCYRCLEEAVSLATPLLSRFPAAARQRFDAAVLLAARDRELGMRAPDHLPLARAWTPPADDLVARYLLVTVECTWAYLLPGVAREDGDPCGCLSPRDPGAPGGDPPVVQFRRILCDRPPLEGDRRHARAGPALRRARSAHR